MSKVIDKNMIRDRALKLPVVTNEMYKKCNYETREIVEEFFAAKSQLSKDTKVQYRSALNQFVYWLHENAMDKPLHKVKKRDFVRFMSYLVNRGMSSSGLKFKKSAISSLCKYIEDNIVEDDDMPEYSRFRNFTTSFTDIPKNHVYDKIPVSEEEYNKIKEVLLDDGNYLGLAWVAVAFSSGARRGGIIQFKSECVKDGIPEGKSYVMTNKVREKGRGKDGKIVDYMLNEEAVKYIQLWLDKRGYEHEYIFTTKYNGEIKQMSREWAANFCTSTLSDILGRRINPHLFKASAVTNLLSKGKDIKIVSKYIAKHNDISTTMNHYDLRQDEGLEEIFD